MMTIDSHTHLGDFPLFNVKLDVKGMLQIMDECNLSKCIVFSLPNELTLNAMRKYPERIEGLVWINPYHGDEAIRLIDKAMTEWGFKGIKMHPLLDAYLPDQEVVHPVMDRARKYQVPVLLDAYLPDQEVVHPVMDRARKYQVPVLFHCGHPPWSLPWHFAALAETYPDVTIILGHMGHGHIVYINGAISIAKKHENIILETSGMPMHSKVKQAVSEVGETRVIYGSDMPFGHPAFEIKKVEVSGLTKKQLDLVFDQNARKIFSIC